MKSHPYLRAYMSGISVPTPLLLIALTLFSIARFVYDVPIPVERVIIFPMTIIPNLFGVWNVLYLASRSHTHLPLGIHGAVLPFILAPLGFLLGRSLGPEGDRPRLPLLWCRERALRAHSNCLSRGADCLLPGLEVPDRILQSSGRNRGVVNL